MIRRPPRSTRTETLVPYTTLFRSQRNGAGGIAVTERRVARRGAGKAQRLEHGIVECAAAGEIGDAEGNVVEHRKAVLCVGLTVSVILAPRRLPDAPSRHLGHIAILRSCLLPPPSCRHRSAERRVGTECVRTCRSRWPPPH